MFSWHFLAHIIFQVCGCFVKNVCPINNLPWMQRRGLTCTRGDRPSEPRRLTLAEPPRAPSIRLQPSVSGAGGVCYWSSDSGPGVLTHSVVGNADKVLVRARTCLCVHVCAPHTVPIGPLYFLWSRTDPLDKVTQWQRILPTPQSGMHTLVYFLYCMSLLGPHLPSCIHDACRSHGLLIWNYCLSAGL